MMIRPDVLVAIRDGRVDLAFRRWDRPRVVVGTRLRTRVGQVRSGRAKGIWSWKGTYFATGMPDGCWGWIMFSRLTIRCSWLYSGSQPATRTPRRGAADRSGPAAAAKEEAQ